VKKVATGLMVGASSAKANVAMAVKSSVNVVRMIAFILIVIYVWRLVSPHFVGHDVCQYPYIYQRTLVFLR
jgi:hypothetical protein